MCISLNITLGCGKSVCDRALIKKLTRLINMFNNKIDTHSNRLQMTNKQRRYYPIQSLTRFHLSIAADLHTSVNSISDDTHSASINTVSR